MSDHVFQDALSDAAHALGRDRGRRNETIADRILALRAERDELKAEVAWLKKEVRYLATGDDRDRPDVGIRP